MAVRFLSQGGLRPDGRILHLDRTPLPHLASMKPCSARHQDDVAEQLRQAGRALEAWGAGWKVKRDHDRAALEVTAAQTEDVGLSIVAVFNDGGDFGEGWENWLELRLEADGEAEVLLTLAWLEGSETDIDASLPLEQRGLNAIADVREGRLARGDAVKALAKEVKARAGAGGFYRTSAAEIFLPAPVRSGSAGKIEEPDDVPVASDVEFEVPEVEAVSAPSAIAVRAPQRRTPSLEELNERLIGEVVEAMQRELVQKDAQFARAGMHSTAKGRLAEGLEWAVLGVCYYVETRTNQVSMSSIMGEAGSWAFGLIGPVVIGWLASLGLSDSSANTKTGKEHRPGVPAGRVAGIGLIAGWALTMAMVTASTPDYVKRAQALFPKGPVVLAHEKALAAARLDAAAAEREVRRIESKPSADTARLVAEAKKRWQAKALEAAAAAEREHGDAALGAARRALKETQATLSAEEFARDQALLGDPSAAWAWRSVAGILLFINVIVPLAVAWIIEKFRRDHAAAKAKAQADHVLGEEAKFLRQGRPAQKARAIQLMAVAMERLEREGVPVALLDGLEGASPAETAAGRFDRIVNAEKFKRRFRLFGPSKT